MGKFQELAIEQLDYLENKLNGSYRIVKNEYGVHLEKIQNNLGGITRVKTLNSYSEMLAFLEGIEIAKDITK